jgi:hypothetical protein
MEQSLRPRELAGFLAKFDPPIAAIAKAVLASLRKRLPNFLELVYDNYNALAIGFGPTERASDAVFSIALFPRWVSFFFLQAKGLPDPHGLLKGNGNRSRHIVLAGPADLDDPRIVELMRDALDLVSAVNRPQLPYRMIIKSVSAKQRPRRPVESSAKAPKPTRLKRAAMKRGAD